MTGLPTCGKCEVKMQFSEAKLAYVCSQCGLKLDWEYWPWRHRDYEVTWQ